MEAERGLGWPHVVALLAQQIDGEQVSDGLPRFVPELTPQRVGG